MMKFLVQVSALMVIALPTVRSAAVSCIALINDTLFHFSTYIYSHLVRYYLSIVIRFSNRQPSWIGCGNRRIKQGL